MNPEIITLAKEIATRAHAGLFRRDGVTPAIAHPAAVVGRLTGDFPVVVATAWLHDVLEDTKETPESLRAAGIPDSVIDAVKALTKKKGVTYDRYLAYVYVNWVARKVKIADMLSNLSDSPTNGQIIKYAKGLLYLMDA